MKVLTRLFLFVLFCSFLSLLPNVNGDRPNILFIMADDLGWNDVQWHNSKMPTPNLHKLALNGVLLNQSYVNQVCSPTRSAFLTGYYPFHTGMQGDAVFNGMEPGGVPLKFPFLAQKFKEIGYETFLVGKWHLGYCNHSYVPTGRGFDHFYGLYNGKIDYFSHIYELTVRRYYMRGLDLWNTEGHPQFNATGAYSTELFTQKAIDFLNSGDKQRPFFMYLAYNAPHYPLEVPNRYLEPCKHYKNRKRRIYCGMIHGLDHGIGKLIRALKKSRQYKNTIIVFSTDNGGETNYGGNNYPLRGNKHTLWEGGNRAISFLHAPKFVTRPGVRHDLFTIVDWYPTLLAAAGVEIEKYGDGINQWPMIAANAKGKRKQLVYNIYGKNTAAIRKGRYKLIMGNPGKPNGWIPEPNLGKLVRKKLPTNDVTPLWLFDLRRDPSERRNLARRRPRLVALLRNIVKKLRKEMAPSVHKVWVDKRGDPKLFNNTMASGWCK